MRSIEERRTFSNKPEHGWASHGSDAFRYLATMARFTIQMLRPKAPPAEIDWTRRPTFRDALLAYRQENPRRKRPYIPPAID